MEGQEVQITPVELDNEADMIGDSDEEELVEGEEPAPSQAKNKEKKAKKPQKEENLCLGCNKKCASSQASVFCQLCSLWCHKDCAGMSNAVFKSLALQVKEVGMAFWACKSCLNFAAKTNVLLKNMNSQISNMKAEIVKNTEDISTAKKEIGKLDGGLKKVERKVEDVKKQVEEELLEELRDREQRKLNLIIYGVAEPEEARDNRERMERDKDTCVRIFNSMEIGAGREQIKFYRRLGERGREPRPIMMGITREEYKRQILENARKLRGSKYEHVSISADLTKRQRQEEQKMKEEAEKRNRTLTEEEKAKNLVWMVVGRKGEKRLIKGEDRGPGPTERRDRRRSTETGARRKEGGAWGHSYPDNRRQEGARGAGREREETQRSRGDEGREREKEGRRSQEQERLLAQLEKERRENRRLTAQLETNRQGRNRRSQSRT